MPSERSIGSASSYTPPKKSQSGYDRAQQNRQNIPQQRPIVQQQSGYDRAQQNRANNAAAAAKAALIARQAGYDRAQENRVASAQATPQAAPAPVYSPPVNYSGSGRVRGYDSGGGGGVESSYAAPQTAAAFSVQAPQAAVAPPPPVFAEAGGGNVAGNSFETISGGQGTFGQEQRRRQSRGPRTDLSVTPEMLQRAAMRRLG